MDNPFYQRIYDTALAGKTLGLEESIWILTSPEVDLPQLVAAAYRIRKRYFGKEVTVHILNNAQNGLCSEDCRYCAQSSSSEALIAEYDLKEDEEILEEARAAYEQGAFRYCLVFSGGGPSDERIGKLTGLIREIKRRWPIEVCVSPGVLSRPQALELKQAGLDRLNHNLNTSARYYGNICTTHTYEDRLQTLANARAVGLQVCSGVIIGMGEAPEDVVQMAIALRNFEAESIPVNFLIPIPGIAIKEAKDLTPEYCLRVLCLFRFLNPAAEIRMAAGREIHLRSLEPLGFYVANSIFLQGYLNARGSSNARTLQMIKDLGFQIKSERKLDELLREAEDCGRPEGVKGLEELRPFLAEKGSMDPGRPVLRKPNRH